MERLGLVGLPNSGKSTLFNALTGMASPVAPHPFSTTETHVGVAVVPDERVDRLAAVSHSQRVTHAHLEVTDIAALVRGASRGEGLGTRFLGSLREVDGLVFVLRAFEDEEVPGVTDPASALEELELELVLADLASVEGRLQRQRKAAAADKSLAAELHAFEKAAAALDAGLPLYRAGLSPEEVRLLAPAFLLTTKPTLVVVNVGEDQIDEADEIAGGVGDGAIAVCAQLEMEAAGLDPTDRSEVLEALGLGEGVTPRIARAAYERLGRRTFFTTNENETRAWTCPAGATALECAGMVHSDMARGFIRAEVIPWDELVGAGSWARARELGRGRLEGKDYEVRDGDVLHIRFSV